MSDPTPLSGDNLGASPRLSGLVPAAGRFIGLVAFRGQAELDGELEGEVLAEGSLRLGPSARLRGDVEVDELVVAGRLEGDVRARRRIELRATARVRGTLEAPLVVMADGSLLDGCCRTGTPGEASDDEVESASSP